jgi:hypothetical protein
MARFSAGKTVYTPDLADAKIIGRVVQREMPQERTQAVCQTLGGLGKRGVGEAGEPLAASRLGAITLVVSSNYNGLPALAVSVRGARRMMSAGHTDTLTGASFLPPGSFSAARRTRG